MVRGAAAVYVVVQVAIWHDYYAAHPWYLAGPLAAVAWGGAPRPTCAGAVRPGR